MLVVRARLGYEMSGFVPGLRFSFFLIEKLLIAGQNFFSKCLKMAPAVYKRDNCRTPGCSSANKTNSYPGPGVVKGRRRRFRLVSEQKKTVEREFRF